MVVNRRLRALAPARGRWAFLPDAALVGMLLLFLQSYAAGYSDAEILEIIAHVALNTFTNYVNEALGTEIDFPRVDRLAA